MLVVTFLVGMERVSAEEIAKFKNKHTKLIHLYCWNPYAPVVRLYYSEHLWCFLVVILFVDEKTSLLCCWSAFGWLC